MAKFSNRKFQEFSRHFQVPGRDKAPGLWDRSVHGKTKSADFAGLEKRHLENEGMTVQSVTKCQETWKLGTKHTRINRNISLYPCRCSSVDWKKHVRLEGVSWFFLCHLAKFVLFVLRIRWCNSPNICGQNWRRPKAPLMWFFLLKLYVSCRLITVRGADEDLVLGRPEQKTLWTSEGSWSLM